MKSVTFNYIRKNVFPLNYYKKGIELINSIDYVSELFDNDLTSDLMTELMWNILFSSPNFYFYLKNKTDKKLNEKEKITLIKYFLRSISKATPFSFFSQICLNEGNDISVVDLDSEWSYSIFDINKVTINSNNINLFSFFVDSNVIFDKSIVLVFSKGQSTTAFELNEIYHSFLNYLKSVKTIKEITEWFLINNIELNHIEIIEFLEQLIEFKIVSYTVSGYYGYSSNIQRYLNLKNTLFSNELPNLNSLLIDLNKKNVRKLSREKIEKITLNLKNIKSSKLYFHVEDYKKNKIYGNMYEKTKKNLQQLFNETFKILSLFPEIEFKQNIKNYIHENYGKNTLVPFIEIYNIFSDEQNYKETFKYDKNIQNIIKRRLQEKIFNSELDAKECDLHKNGFFDDLFNDMLTENYLVRKQTISSSDININSLINEDGEIIFSMLDENIGSGNAGQMYGRFSYKTSLKKEYDSFIKKKIELYQIQQKEIVEIVTDDIETDTRNVLPKTHSNIENEILLSTYKTAENKNIININDVYIYVSDDDIYIFSDSMQKDIAIINHHSLNSEYASDIYEFLEAISYSTSLTELLYMIKNEYNKINTNKSIYYNELLLFYKEIKFPAVNSINDEKLFMKKFDRWGRNQGIINKDFIFFYINDERILINLKDKLQKKFFLTELKKDNIIKFKRVPDEWIGYLKNVSGTKDISNADLIFSYCIVKGHKQEQYLSKTDLQNVYNSTLGEKVIYLKLYLNQRYEFEFIKKYLLKITKEIKKNKNIVGTSFVRYKEKATHIRFRVFLKTNNIHIKTPIIEYLAETLNNINYIDYYEIVPYRREYVRYGRKLTAKYEKISMLESELVIEFINKYPKKTIKPILFRLIIELLKTLEKERVFVKKYKSLDKEGRSIKTKFQSKKYKILKEVQAMDVYSEPYNNWLNYIKDYFNELEQGLDNKLFDIIHMLCNRFIGIDRYKENQYMIELSVIINYLIHNS